MIQLKSNKENIISVPFGVPIEEDFNFNGSRDMVVLSKLIDNRGKQNIPATVISDICRKMNTVTFKTPVLKPGEYVFRLFRQDDNTKLTTIANVSV